MWPVAIISSAIPSLYDKLVGANIPIVTTADLALLQRSDEIRLPWIILVRDSYIYNVGFRTHTQ